MAVNCAMCINNDYCTERYKKSTMNILKTCPAFSSVINMQPTHTKVKIKDEVEITINDISKYIQNVIFNPPATIILWEDGTKTVVKAQEDDEFDPEAGFTMAVTKKVFGNTGRYYETVKKWCEPWYEKEVEALKLSDAILESLYNICKINVNFNKDREKED